MMRSGLALAATTLLLAACGDSDTSKGAVEGPVVSTAESPMNPAIEAAAPSDPNTLTPGASSFTSAQAREAIEKQGYTDVGPLTQNDQGIWSASAMRNGAQATVSVDYKGVVTAG